MTSAVSQSSDGTSAGPRVPAIGLSFAAIPRPFAGPAAPKYNATKLADGAGLILLMLSAGALLFRPADLIPALSGVPIYQFLVTACIIVSLPRMMAQLTAQSLRTNGI